MRITKKQIQDYCENGYLLIPNALDVNVVNQIRSKSKEIFARQLENANIHFEKDDEESFEQGLYKLFRLDYEAFIGAAKLCQHQLELQRLAVSERIVDTIKQLGVRDPSICVKPIVYFNSKNIAKQVGHYKTPSHQDWRSMQGSVNSMVVWIPLVDINNELGALEVIPKSHTQGLFNTVKDEWFRTIKDSRIDKNNFTSLEVKVGDVVCFNSFLIHQSGNNVTENIRWSMHFRYNDMNEASFIRRKFPHPYQVYTPYQDIVFPDFHPEKHLNQHLNELTKN
jgi:phytanoyl-CoA hydroxylase